MYHQQQNIVAHHVMPLFCQHHGSNQQDGTILGKNAIGLNSISVISKPKIKHSYKDPYPTYRGNFRRLGRGKGERELSEECLKFV